MYISDKELNREAEKLFKENKSVLKLEGSKALTVVSYLDSLNETLKTAPVPITAFGKLFVILFYILIIGGIVLPCVSGLFRIGLWELANIGIALLLFGALSMVKNAIGLKKYMAEDCKSGFCKEEVSALQPPKDEFADFYDEKRRLYMKYVRDKNGRLVDSAPDPQSQAEINEDEGDENNNFAF